MNSSTQTNQAGTTDDSSPGENRGRVLVVDDEPEVLAALRRQLQREFDVLTAQSGEAGLDVLRRECVDVIISDQRMPGMTGAEFLEQARTLSPYSTRIMLTGYADMQSIVDAVNDAKIYGYMAKPWDINDIRTKIHNALSYTRLQLENQRYLEELEQAKAAAEAADRAKSDFLANINHEVRTPLNAIMGMSFLLARAELSPEHRDRLATIEAAGQRLLSLFNDILEVSGVDDGDNVSVSTMLNLNTVVRSVHLSHVRQAEEKGVALRLESAQIPPHLLGDPVRLPQVLNHLVGNAVKFTDAGEVVIRLTVASESEDDLAVRFEVTDTGIGIADAFRDRLFSFFSQGDSSSTRRFGGIGLGLSVSQKLVGAMGGRIRVESEPGKGSLFWFTLTFDKPKAAEAVTAFSTGQAVGDAARDAVTAGSSTAAAADLKANAVIAELMTLLAQADARSITFLERSWETISRTLGDEAAALRAEIESFDYASAMRRLRTAGRV